MNISEVIQLGREFMYTVLLLSLPTLATSLLVGLVVSVFQAVTSINEQNLSYVPRMVAVGLVVVLTMPWAIQVAMHFTVSMLWKAAEVGR